jgi:NitT/TauT family transport system ATP-binding protein
MIQLNAISHSYSTRSGTLRVLENVSHTFQEGKFYSIVGPSGCGKSTLLKILGGLIQPTEGSVQRHFLERDRRPAYVFQDPVLLRWKTVGQNIRLPDEIFGIQRQASYYTNLLRQFKLDGFENCLPHELSGGMQARVALARALAPKPKCLFLDEPFSGNDYLTRDQLNVDLLNLWQAHRWLRMVVLVTHNISEAILLSDEVLVFSERPARLIGSVTVHLPSRTLNAKGTQAFASLESTIRSKIHVS